MEERDMQIVLVDERDSHWESTTPRFRVYLQTKGGPRLSHSTATYDVIGGDVMKVIDWAAAEAGSDLAYGVALVHDDALAEQTNPGCGRGLIWLVGRDLNDSSSVPD
ncbi:hypothetical protein [Nocardioides houyundeii]|uniref:hypothetical protein n=1 Tax=Nocardioides houyundeii TaxID=2045452 RepID=UPI0013155885|nr:hypothetical protein [Nocardioides houyundeii]